MRGADREDFLQAAADPVRSLAEAALLMARIEYPHLNPEPYLRQLDAIGRQAGGRVAEVSQDAAAAAPPIAALTRYIYGELGFTGNRRAYDDPHNSLLNRVLERRTGIPITLAVVFIEIGGRAGVQVEGVNFPGHFLLRAPASADWAGELLIDPFHDGAVLSRSDCQRLLEAHAGRDAVLSTEMFAAAGKRDILLRMLLNLKRAYVRMRSFPQARDATDLLVAMAPTAVTELRDRGLLSYHLQDLSSALRDLRSYLERAPAPDGEDARRERDQIWEHVKALRKRLASFN